MKNKRLLTLLIVLVLIIIAAAVVFYINNYPASQNPITPSPTSQQPAVTQPQGTAPAQQTSLTADEKAALAASANGSTVAQDQQIALATKAAKETGSINVAGCQLDPVVLKVKYQTNFTLKNSGTDDVTVVFYTDNVSHAVPAGGQISVKADFNKQGAGLFGYYCRAGSAAYQGLLLMYSF